MHDFFGIWNSINHKIKLYITFNKVNAFLLITYHKKHNLYSQQRDPYRSGNKLRNIPTFTFTSKFFSRYCHCKNYSSKKYKTQCPPNPFIHQYIMWSQCIPWLFIYHPSNISWKRCKTRPSISTSANTSFNLYFIKTCPQCSHLINIYISSLYTTFRPSLQ